MLIMTRQSKLFLCTSTQMFSLSFTLQDAFRAGNLVQLIARSNGYPIRITNATVFGNGTFTHTDSECRGYATGFF